jgi:opacity protein-like surface antigen
MGMRKIILFLMFAAAAATSCASEAVSGYAALKGAYANAKLRISGVGFKDSAPAQTFAAGLSFYKKIRTEVEYSNFSAMSTRDDGLSGDMKISGLMANIFYSHYEDENVELYAGLGAGVSFIDWRLAAGNIYLDGRDNNFTYAFLVGLSFAVVRDFNADFGFRWFYMNGKKDYKLRVIAPTIGVRYTF